MKILCQIVSVLPLSLIVSLPNQLFGHVPITQISSQLTALLERIDQNTDEEEDQDQEEQEIPDLANIFSPGQYLRAVVTTVHAPGTTDTFGVRRLKDDTQRVSRRIELSLEPHKVNGGVATKDLTPGFVS